MATRTPPPDDCDFTQIKHQWLLGVLYLVREVRHAVVALAANKWVWIGGGSFLWMHKTNLFH